MVLKKSWVSQETPLDWRKANFTLIFQNDMKEDPGNYKPFSINPVIRKVIERNHFQTYKGQVGDWEKSAWIYNGENMSEQQRVFCRI